MTTFSTKSKLAALAAIATAALASGAHAQDANQSRDIRDFRIVNNNGAVIQSAWIAIARPGTPWVSIDLSSPIAPKAVREIAMTGFRGASCYYDVKVAFDDGTTSSWSNVNLCRVTNLAT